MISLGSSQEEKGMAMSTMDIKVQVHIETSILRRRYVCTVSLCTSSCRPPICESSIHRATTEVTGQFTRVENLNKTLVLALRIADECVAGPWARQMP